MAEVGTTVITEETFGTVKKVVFDWTSDGDGAVSGNSTTKVYTGEVIRLVTVPDGGDDAPADNYNVKIHDEDGTDILMGGGATRDTANTEQVLASSLGCVCNDKLELVIDSAGATNKGVVYVYIR